MPDRPGLYVSHPACLAHDPRVHMPEHPDTPERLLAIERELAGHDWPGWVWGLAPPAEAAELELVHCAGHVERIRELSLAGGGAIDADTFVGEPSYRAALHAAGGACEMTRALLAGEAALGFCGVRPSGHHAEPDRAMGFCLFNNIALAAALAIAELGARRVLILDWDVHHGNGTAETFRHRSDVLFASIHQSGIYPGTGPLNDVGSGPGLGYTINLPVPAGSEAELWLSLLAHIVLPAAASFEPDLVLVSAGFDAHVADPLAGCRLQTSTFADMSRHVRDFAAERSIPLGWCWRAATRPPSWPSASPRPSPRSATIDRRRPPRPSPCSPRARLLISAATGRCSARQPGSSTPRQLGSPTAQLLRSAPARQTPPRARARSRPRGR